MVEILDILGFIFGVAGAILVGRINRWGLICFIIGSTAHGLMGSIQGTPGLVLTCTVFIIIDLYYFKKWSEREKNKE